MVQRDRLVTDVEVLHEIRHRYTAIQRRDRIQPAADAVLGIVDEVLALDAADLDAARGITLGSTRLSARDAIQVALMRRHRIGTILSSDADFDGVPRITRLSRQVGTIGPRQLPTHPLGLTLQRCQEEREHEASSDARYMCKLRSEWEGGHAEPKPPSGLRRGANHEGLRSTARFSTRSESGGTDRKGPTPT